MQPAHGIPQIQDIDTEVDQRRRQHQSHRAKAQIQHDQIQRRGNNAGEDTGDLVKNEPLMGEDHGSKNAKGQEHGGIQRH